MSAYRELPDLCTDPSAGTCRPFMMARSAVMVTSAAETLAATGGGNLFAHASRELAAAREAVADYQGRCGDEDEP